MWGKKIQPQNQLVKTFNDKLFLQLLHKSCVQVVTGLHLNQISVITVSVSQERTNPQADKVT